MPWCLVNPITRGGKRELERPALHGTNTQSPRRGAVSQGGEGETRAPWDSRKASMTLIGRSDPDVFITLQFHKISQKSGSGFSSPGGLAQGCSAAKPLSHDLLSCSAPSLPTPASLPSQDSMHLPPSHSGQKAGCCSTRMYWRLRCLPAAAAVNTTEKKPCPHGA